LSFSSCSFDKLLAMISNFGAPLEGFDDSVGRQMPYEQE